MSYQERACLVAVCDGCGRSYMGYEDEFTVHFDSPAEFAEWQRDAEPEQRWKVEARSSLSEQHEKGDRLLCVECWCAEESHPRDPHIYRIGKPHQYCRCGKSWDIEVGA